MDVRDFWTGVPAALQGYLKLRCMIHSFITTLGLFCRPRSKSQRRRFEEELNERMIRTIDGINSQKWAFCHHHMLCRAASHKDHIRTKRQKNQIRSTIVLWLWCLCWIYYDLPKKICQSVKVGYLKRLLQLHGCVFFLSFSTEKAIFLFCFVFNKNAVFVSGQKKNPHWQ